jgi:hypothetical protein
MYCFQIILNLLVGGSVSCHRFYEWLFGSASRNLNFFFSLYWTMTELLSKRSGAPDRTEVCHVSLTLRERLLMCGVIQARQVCAISLRPQYVTSQFISPNGYLRKWE